MNFLWGLPPEEVALESLEQAVHVWCAALPGTLTHEKKTSFLALLSPQEKSRAEKFYFEKDRCAYLATRGLLRKILACYLKIDAQNLRFSYNVHGKPALVDYAHLQFNVSHSRNVALLAVALNTPVGVDIEYKKRNCRMEAIAKRFFLPEEYKTVSQLSGSEKINAFFNLWVSKEALSKSLGGKLFDLKNIEADVVDSLSLQHLPPPWVDFAAALAIKGPIHSVKTWRLAT